MTRGNGLPCKRCGTAEWDNWGHCKKCHRDRARQWREENPEKAYDSIRRWREHNRERDAEHTKRWRKNNPDKYREIKRRWIQENPEKVRTMANRWVKNNLEKVRDNTRRWAANNPKKVNAKNNKRRTKKTGAGGSYTAAEFKQLCEQYDNRCLCCGKKKNLAFDHVIPVNEGGSSDISNGQPLCLSCNASKGTKTTDYRTKPGVKRWIQRKLFD